MIDESKMTLAVDMTGDRTVKGWLASEKIFDCRAYWQSGEFWTRSGHLIEAPKWFKRGLPKCDIDGGIYAGRKGFQAASNAVRFGGKWFEQPDLEFVAFDFPGLEATWDRRILEAKRAVKNSATGRAVQFERIRDIHHFTEFLLRIRKLGGEGGIFRNPDVVGYEVGRSKNYLRFKYEQN